MRIAGIDYSMTGPSICLMDPDESIEPEACQFFFLTDTQKYQGSFWDGRIVGKPFQETLTNVERFAKIAAWAVETVGDGVSVMLEDYAMGARGRVFHIGENGGILKLRLWENNIDVDVVSPTVVKKLATGKGNAAKQGVYDAFCKRAGIDLKDQLNSDSTKVGSPFSDIADSYYMALHGANER